MRRMQIIATFLILLVAAIFFRFTNLDWDEYNHYHPDERYISWVVTSIRLPQSWSEAIDPQRSPLNPYRWPPAPEVAVPLGVVVPVDSPRQFTYGHLPLYLGAAAAHLSHYFDPLFSSPPQSLFRRVTAAGRWLTALFELGSVLLIWGIGRRLYGEMSGLLGMGLLATAVLHIQLAHFFTFDQYMTFFTLAALYGLVRGQKEGDLWLLFAAVMAGFAVGSKFSAILLVIPFFLLAWMEGGAYKKRVARFLIWIAVGIIAFALTNPFAFIDQSCDLISPAMDWAFLRLPAINWGSCLLLYVGEQGAMVRGAADIGFIRQYAGTAPYAYFLEMQWRWGLGPLLTVAAYGGLLHLLWRLRPQSLTTAGLQARWQQNSGELLILAWFLPYFLSTGNFSVKFMRYMAPVTPLLILFAAQWIWLGLQKWPRARIGVAAVVFGTSLLSAITFQGMYQQPHPWVAASEWLYAEAPQGSMIVTEEWDDQLPTGLFRDGSYFGRDQFDFRGGQLSWLTYPDAADDEFHLATNVRRLAMGDYVVIASNRIYGVVPRLPERYPLSSQYHQMLFDGRLGYELVYVTNRSPNLAGFHLQPDYFSWPQLAPPDGVTAYYEQQSGVRWGRVDESFTVYDQPLVMIFYNSGRLSSAEISALFERTLTD